MHYVDGRVRQRDVLGRTVQHPRPRIAGRRRLEQLLSGYLPLAPAGLII